MHIRHAWPLLILVAVSSSGRADDQVPAPPPPTAEAKAEAKKHIEAGTKFYNVQQYAAAADEYQQAYLLDPKPAYLYASAQSQRLGGDCAKALMSYRSYLRTNPPEAERVKAEANITRCEQEIRDHETAVDPATIPPPYEVPPPPIPVEAPPPAPPPPPPPPGKSYVLGYLMLGAGVAAAAGGVYLFQDGRSAITDHNDAPTYDAWVASRELDAAKRNQALGVAAMAGGAALITGGVVYFVLRSRGGEQQPPVTTAVAADKAMVFFTRPF